MTNTINLARRHFTSARVLLWPRSGERLLPALSGILLAASFPPLHLLVPPFVGLVPFALWVQDLSRDAEGRHAAVRGSLVFGSMYFGLVFYWILIALIWFTWLAIPAFVGLMMMFVGLAAFFGWALHHFLHTARAPLWIALPIAWTAAEWFRAHWPSTLASSWLGLGTSLTGFPELVGFAEIVGARGVTLWLALVNGLIASLVLDLRARRGWGQKSLLILLAITMPMGWGLWRAETLQLREAGRVAVVQPNIPEHIKLDQRIAIDSTHASLNRLMQGIEPGSVDLVVMPEVTLPVFPKAEVHSGFVAPILNYARELGVPVVFGATGFTGDIYGEFTPFNSAFVMEPSGLTDFQYDKRYLVPFVERVPFLPDSWLTGLPYFGGFGVGSGWPLLKVNGSTYGVLICYESTYPEGARTFRLKGAEVLLNITNDAWYGRELFYARTTALWQHPAHLVMRAIENRMGVARSANTGISLYVDPIGRVHGQTDLFESDIRIDNVLTTDEITFFTRFGDLAGNGAAFAAFLLILASLKFSRRSASLDPSEAQV